MMSDCADNQTFSTYINVHKVNKIYYAHSIGLYNTQREQEDLEFLSSLNHSKVINPNGPGLGKSMIPYLRTVKKCNSLWYRGYSPGVVLEVLVAETLRKPVFSLETRKAINRNERDFIIHLFNKNPYRDHDIDLLYPSIFELMNGTAIFMSKHEFGHFLGFVSDD